MGGQAITISHNNPKINTFRLYPATIEFEVNIKGTSAKVEELKFNNLPSIIKPIYNNRLWKTIGSEPNITYKPIVSKVNNIQSGTIEVPYFNIDKLNSTLTYKLNNGVYGTINLKDLLIKKQFTIDPTYKNKFIITIEFIDANTIITIKKWDIIGTKPSYN